MENEKNNGVGVVSMMEKQLIPVGYKQTEVGIIPNDWRIEPLCDVLDKNRHIRYGVVQPGKYTPDGCLMLRSQDYSKGWSDADGMHRLNKILEKQFQNAKLKSGDLVITIVGAGVAQIVEVPEWIDGTILSRSTARIAVNEEVASSKFILYVMSSSLGRTQVLFNIKEGAQPVVSSSDVGSCLIPLPDKQEQTAIANALSDVDALIAALEKLINKKSAIKTAAMQQLLTGKKRLPPFDQLNTGYKQTELGEIPGDWELVPFYEIASLKNVRTNPKVNGGGDYCIELEHIKQASGALDGNTITTPLSSLKNNFVEGDVLFGKLRSYLRKYWMADRKGVCSTEIWVFAANKEKIVSEFLYQTIKTERFIECTTEAYGTHMPRSDWKIVKEFLVPTPSIDEQTAIAHVLSDMDKDLEALQQRLHKTQQIKQGMMQELLTGKTRLVPRAR